MSMLQGTYGLTITMTTGVDITGATSAAFKIKDPAGKKKEVVATIDDVVTGKISYVTQNGDFNKVGTYLIQGIIVFAAKKLKTEIVEFAVDESL